MNLTIPKRPYNPAPKFSGSVQNKKAERKRYAVSIVTALFIVGALITGSVGSLLQVAEAKPNYGAYFNNLRNRNAQENDASRTTNQSTNTSRTTNTTPAKPAPANTTTPARQAPVQTPAPQQTPAPSASQTPATRQPAAVQPVTAKPAQPAAPVVDTAPQVATLTAAQAQDSAASAKTVTYTSNKISNETRDRILIMAAVAGITATLLYIMSLIGTGASASRRQQVPVRYIVPIKEGALR
jgi:cytoskeletal protein RodZ